MKQERELKTSYKRFNAEEERLFLKEIDEINNKKPRKHDPKTDEQDKIDEESNGDDLENEENEVVEKKKKKSDGRLDNYLDDKNPWQKSSKIDLNETRKSFRWVETEVLLALTRSKITGSDWAVFMYILHKTRGHCNKNKHYRHAESISIDEIVEYTDLSKSSVYNSLNRLKKRQMIYEYTEGRGAIKDGINFRYDTWL